MKSFLNSLRGRILLATGALIVFGGFSGLVGYLAVSLISVAPIYSFIASVIAMTAATAVFGWWLSNEILRPIETVALLARSLERSPATSLPKTTGAAETDEVLQTLHRNSQQLQNLISLMDDVSSGKTEAAMAPLQNPDRLSVSFQKLVSKVTESIKAKEQLDALQSSVNRLKTAVSGVRSGSLKFELNGEHFQVAEVADSIKFLVGRIGGTIEHVSSNTAGMRDAAEDARRTIRTVIESEEMQSLRLQKASGSLKISPETVNDLASRMDSAVNDFATIFGSASVAGDTQTQDQAVNLLHKHLGESVKHLAKLRERAAAIPQSARSARELSRRASLLGVNTTLQIDPSARISSLICDEITSLSSRAESVNKEILSVNEMLVGELVQLDAALAAISSDVTEVAMNTARNSDLLADIEKFVSRFDALRSCVFEFAGDSSAQHERLVKALSSGTSDVDNVALLKEAEQAIVSVLNLTGGLEDSVTGLKSFASMHVPVAAAVPAVTMSAPSEAAGLAGEN
ncbi:MAG: hypothetical protein ACR2IH_03240 [Pyrinomonadaceae bacterium]